MKAEGTQVEKPSKGPDGGVDQLSTLGVIGNHPGMQQSARNEGEGFWVHVNTGRPHNFVPATSVDR